MEAYFRQGGMRIYVCKALSEGTTLHILQTQVEALQVEQDEQAKWLGSMW